jgi:DNA-binding XRE family transcriptional regulator
MSKRKRTTRKANRTPEELAELRAERERFGRERPNMAQLLASGEYDGPFEHGAYLDLLQALAALRRQREGLGLSLSEVSERSGIDKAALSRLENGLQPNPTLSTLTRYAAALGKTVRLSFADLDAATT